MALSPEASNTIEHLDSNDRRRIQYIPILYYLVTYYLRRYICWCTSLIINVFILVNYFTHTKITYFNPAL